MGRRSHPGYIVPEWLLSLILWLGIMSLLAGTLHYFKVRQDRQFQIIAQKLQSSWQAYTDTHLISPSPGFGSEKAEYRTYRGSSRSYARPSGGVVAVQASPALKPLPINACDSAELEALPGIGPVLASRIVRFRDLLGGFYALAQLREVYGLDSSRFAFIESFFIPPRLGEWGCLDLDSISREDLARHPYLTWRHAKLWQAYREQHKPPYTAGEIQKAMHMHRDEWLRCAPYICVARETPKPNP